MNLYLTLYKIFFKIGLTCFGGGYGMMSMIREECQRVGLTAQEFADMSAMDLLASGPVALNAPTYVGYIKGGFFGAFFATLGIITPSILVCVIALFFINKFRTSVFIRGLFRGITPACAGLLIYTCINLFAEVFFNQESITQIFTVPLTVPVLILLGIFAAAVIAIFRFKVDAIPVTFAGALLGLLLLR